MKKIALTLGLLLMANVSAATNDPEGDITASVNVSTSFNVDTGLYTYTYSITNNSGSAKLLDEFYIPLAGASVSQVTSPQGWNQAIYLKNSSKAMIGWCACDESGFVFSGDPLEELRGVPSKYTIAAGQTLSGFSFQSPYAPTNSKFFASSWVPLPIEGVDIPIDHVASTDSGEFPDNLYKGATSGPAKNDLLNLGGRRPAADAFLVFLNVEDRAAYNSPMIIDFTFGPNGEQVIKQSFSAVLNGADVTGVFKEVDTNRYRAVFQVNPGSPLLQGRNNLRTSVDGYLPGSNKVVTDVDQISFLIQ